MASSSSRRVAAGVTIVAVAAVAAVAAAEGRTMSSPY